MHKKVFMFLLMLIFILGISKLSFAMTCGNHGSSYQQLAQAESEHIHYTQDVTTQEATSEAVDAGNKICPVSGEEINEETKATYEYEGKIYNFCCQMCIDEFKKDPQRYISKVEEELQASLKEEMTPEVIEAEELQSKEAAMEEAMIEETAKQEETK